MTKSNLFLGFPIDSSFDQLIKQLNPHIINFFIGSNRSNGLNEEYEYLTKITHQDVHYLGKYVGQLCDIETLELVENNIFSLLKKIVPNYPYSESQLLLFPIIAEEK